MGTRPARLREQLRELIREKERPLLRYTMRLTGDLERARDVVQEAFLRLCAREDAQLEADLAEGRTTAWLFTVCRHRAIDIHRKERHMDAFDSAQVEAYPSPEASASSQLERKQHVHQIHGIVHTLPAIQREVVQLKFQEGLSYKQISEITSLSVSHVGVVLHKAVKAIRQELAGREHEAANRMQPVEGSPS